MKVIISFEPNLQIGTIIIITKMPRLVLISSARKLSPASLCDFANDLYEKTQNMEVKL